MPPFLPGEELLSFIVGHPWQGLCMPFSFIGAMGALAYFPHIALGKGPRRRRLTAAIATVTGAVWLILSYLVAKSTEPNVDFVYTEAFASFAAFGALTLVAERYFGHPFFQSEKDVGPRLLARSKRRQGYQRSWLDRWL